MSNKTGVPELMLEERTEATPAMLDYVGLLQPPFLSLRNKVICGQGVIPLHRKSFFC